MATNWSDLIGNQRIVSWFSAALRQGRLAGSMLFVGSAGIGKTTVANLLAQTLLCETSDPLQMSPCGTCPSCQQVLANTHPDVIRVAKPKDKTTIPLDLLIGPPDARMQEGFCRDIRLKPYSGKRKVAILSDADFLNEEGANCLLKTLEEPPAGALIILIGTSEQRQLPTIRSRCQIIRFSPLIADECRRLLCDVHGVTASDDAIASAVEVSAGDMQVALRLLTADGANEFRQSLDAQLSTPHPDPMSLKRLITKRVEDAGKDASVRRGAMRDVFSTAAQFYRRQLRSDALQSVVQESTLSRLDRCIRALREVDRSANQASLIECFAADIATATTGDRGQIGS